MKDFTYSRISIPNADLIAKELAHLDQIYPDDPKFQRLDLSGSIAMLPTLANWVIKVGIKISMVCHINIQAGMSQTIHIDVGTPKLALNFPIRGCHGAYTKIFRNKGELVTLYTPTTNLRYIAYIDDNPEEICRFVLDAPTLLNVKIPHSVVNTSSENRVCLSLRFETDPWHLLANNRVL